MYAAKNVQIRLQVSAKRNKVSISNIKLRRSDCSSIARRKKNIVDKISITYQFPVLPSYCRHSD